MEINNHIKKMLSDEKYRIEIAIQLTQNDQKAMGLLDMAERTFYHKLKSYGITNRINQKRKDKLS